MKVVLNEIIRETEKAVMLAVSDDSVAWVPKRCIVRIDKQWCKVDPSFVMEPHYDHNRAQIAARMKKEAEAARAAPCLKFNEEGLLVRGLPDNCSPYLDRQKNKHRSGLKLSQ